MDRTERFHRIDDLLNQRKVVPVSVFLEELEVSRATFKRDLEYLRDRLVLTRCEWGKDDYSLNVSNLPMAAEPVVSTNLTPPPRESGRKAKKDKGTADMFGNMGEDASGEDAS